MCGEKETHIIGHCSVGVGTSKSPLVFWGDALLTSTYLMGYRLN